mmetsp:Transcript_22693/g.50904  ORF Transcript_22693/g.50904 Transcript_22693/m.50904 type:complete len:408 (+) Transcript_22693:193-1416(+)
MDPASKVVMEMMEQGQGQGQMEAEGLHNRGPKPTQVQGQGQGQGRGQKADERSSVIFFDAIHPSFSPQVFLQQFMAHFCPPLVFCWGCPANQGYHYTSSLFYLIFNWGHPLCIILMLVSFAFSGTAGLSGAFLMPLVFFSQHKAQVAVKYASLSPTEWARFMSAPRHLSTIYMYQMQLFSSWFSMDEIVMQFEIGASSSRLGARVQKMHLIVADPQTPDTISQFRLWNALLRGQRYVDAGAGTAMELVRRADGHYQLTVTDLCAALIRQGGGDGQPHRGLLHVHEPRHTHSHHADALLRPPQHTADLLPAAVPHFLNHSQLHIRQPVPEATIHSSGGCGETGTRDEDPGLLVTSKRFPYTGRAEGVFRGERADRAEACGRHHAHRLWQQRHARVLPASTPRLHAEWE